LQLLPLICEAVSLYRKNYDLYLWLNLLVTAFAEYSLEGITKRMRIFHFGFTNIVCNSQSFLTVLSYASYKVTVQRLTGIILFCFAMTSQNYKSRKMVCVFKCELNKLFKNGSAFYLARVFCFQ